MHSEPKFICDDHCGRLARWLRFVGYDCADEPDIHDGDLLKQSALANRIILTRDRKMAETALARAVVLVESPVPLDQLIQVVQENNLKIEPDRIGTRCSVCNGNAVSVGLEDVVELVPSYVRRTQTSFRQCTECRRVYWPGTHVQNMIEKLRSAGLF